MDQRMVFHQPFISLNAHHFQSSTDQDHSSLPSSGSSPESSTTESAIHHLLQRYPFAAEPSYFTRLNRYYGPASTWRSWTARDRVVASAIDQERATDLSIHSFNTWALKKRAQGRALDGRKSLTRPNGVDTLTADGHAEEESKPLLVPPRLWTAWPLRGWEVPRHNDSTFPVHGILSDANCSNSPSSNLVETLIATTFKTAKETWNKRKLQLVHRPLNHGKGNLKTERDVAMHEVIDSGAKKSSEPLNFRSDNPPRINASSAIGDVADDQSDVDLPQGVQTFSSQAFLAESSSSETDPADVESENSDLEPIFSADDDSSRRLLIPPTRQILTKLDDLLVGLHKARKSYASYCQRHATSTSQSPSRSRSRSHTTFTGNHVRSDVDLDETSRSEKAEEEYDQFIRTGTPRSRVKEQRRERERGRKRQRSPPVGSPSPPNYGLRDWSDIIGMATLTGWKTETVARAAERCAKLFDENMMFRTFHDQTLSSPVLASARNDQAGGALYDEEFAFVPEQIGTTFDDHDPTRPIQQIPSISHNGVRHIRSSSPCGRCKANKIRCEPSNPLLIPNSHARPNGQADSSIDETDRVSCSACVALETSSTSQARQTTCSGIRIKLDPTNQSSSPSRRGPRICPYPSCERHTRPFKKSYHLERHIHSVHGNHTNTDRRQIRAQTPASSPSKSDSVAEHRLGMELACPVQTCSRHMHNYSRPTRLFAHMKREHSDIDIWRFRALIGQKGESTRGKYDRRKTRSGSRSGSKKRKNNGPRDMSDEDRGEGEDDEEDEDMEDHEKEIARSSRRNHDDEDISLYGEDE